MAILVENSFFYTLADREFYEPIDRYQPRPDDYIAIARRRLPDDWDGGRKGLWYYATPPGASFPDEGWKIHLSATISDAPSVLETACRVLARHRVPFKFAADQRILLLLNSKNWRRGGAGKFITVYPRDTAQCGELLEELYHATIGYSGPYILSDRRYRDSRVVYYRYGGLAPTVRLNVRGLSVPVIRAPDGTLIDDRREPFFKLPPGVVDPFVSGADDASSDESAEGTLKNGRYRVESAISFSNSGGVYVAEDTHTGERVIIKEARPDTNLSPKTRDAVWLLKKEHRLLTVLEETGIAPRPIDFFRDWEHYYLVEELVEGVILRAFTAKLALPLRIRPTLEDAREFVDIYRRLYAAIAEALRVLHQHHIVFGDLSHYNVMVAPDGETVKLIDFEGAYEEGVDVPTSLFTPGFAAAEAIAEGVPLAADDRYALGGLMLAGLMPINEIMGLQPGAYEPLLRSCVRDLGFPETIAECIRGLLHPSRARRPELDEVIRVLRAEPEVRPPEIGADEVDAEDLEALLDGLVAYIESKASPERDDRLYPGAPALFETNPLGIAYGACGVAWALQRITGRTPQGALEWILRRPISAKAYPPGLYVGLAGIAWALLELGESERAEEVLAMADGHPLLDESPDLFYGRAGWGLAQLRFHLASGDPAYLERARSAGDALLASRVRGEDGCWWLTEGDEYAGLGHGGAGIALFLLDLYRATGESEYLRVVREALDHVVACGVRNPDGGLTWTVMQGHPTYTPYWRWGSAGVGGVLLRYEAAVGDGRYEEALASVLLDTDRKYSIFPGLHLGLAGIGDFYLDLERFGRDPAVARAGARKLLAGVLHFKLTRPEGFAFPGESRDRISCDFATGSAGIAYFLHRFLHGGPAAFMLDELLDVAADEVVEPALSVAV
ncbi:MAG TPA: class III lanthionine synthetase LanKC [Longimicrobiales bacterium]